MNEINENLKKNCQSALIAFRKLNKEELAEIQSKLEFVIGSYEYDKNPVGLNEYGIKALNKLKAIKIKQPRKINKKIIEGLEKSLKLYCKN